MAKFARNYTYRTPMRTIEFKAGNETVDAEVIAAADLADALVKQEETTDGSDEPAARSPKGRTINLKG